MVKAVNAVHKGWSVRRAAEQFNIPKSTLGDRVSGRVLPGALSGRQRYLTQSEESELYKFVA